MINNINEAGINTRPNTIYNSQFIARAARRPHGDIQDLVDSSPSANPQLAQAQQEAKIPHEQYNAQRLYNDVLNEYIKPHFTGQSSNISPKEEIWRNTLEELAMRKAFNPNPYYQGQESLQNFALYAQQHRDYQQDAPIIQDIFDDISKRSNQYKENIKTTNALQAELGTQSFADAIGQDLHSAAVSNKPLNMLKSPDLPRTQKLFANFGYDDEQFNKESNRFGRSFFEAYPNFENYALRNRRNAELTPQEEEFIRYYDAVYYPEDARKALENFGDEEKPRQEILLRNQAREKWRSDFNEMVSNLWAEMRASALKEHEANREVNTKQKSEAMTGEAFTFSQHPSNPQYASAALAEILMRDLASTQNTPSHVNDAPKVRQVQDFVAHNKQLIAQFFEGYLEDHPDAEREEIISELGEQLKKKGLLYLNQDISYSNTVDNIMNELETETKDDIYINEWIARNNPTTEGHVAITQPSAAEENQYALRKSYDKRKFWEEQKKYHSEKTDQQNTQNTQNTIKQEVQNLFIQDTLGNDRLRRIGEEISEALDNSAMTSGFPRYESSRKVIDIVREQANIINNGIFPTGEIFYNKRVLEKVLKRLNELNGLVDPETLGRIVQDSLQDYKKEVTLEHLNLGELIDQLGYGKPQYPLFFGSTLLDVFQGRRNATQSTPLSIEDLDIDNEIALDNLRDDWRLFNKRGNPLESEDDILKSFDSNRNHIQKRDPQLYKELVALEDARDKRLLQDEVIKTKNDVEALRRDLGEKNEVVNNLIADVNELYSSIDGGATIKGSSRDKLIYIQNAFTNITKALQSNKDLVSQKEQLLEEQKNEISAIKSELINTQELYSAQQAENEGLIAKQEELNRKYEKNKADLEKKLKEKEERIKEIERNALFQQKEFNNTLTEIGQNHTKAIQDAIAREDGLKKKISNLETEKTLAKSQLEEEQKKNKGLANDLSNAQKDKKEADDKLARKELDMQSLNQTYHKSLNDQRSSETKNYALVFALKDEIASQKRALENMSKEIVTLKEDQILSETKIKDAQNKLDESNGTITTLEEKIALKDKMLKEQGDELSSINKLYGDTQSALNSTQSSLTQEKQLSESNRKEAKSLRTKLNILRDDVKNLNNKLLEEQKRHNITSEGIAKQQTDNSYLLKEKERLQTKLDTANEQAKAMQNEITGLKDKSTGLTNEITGLKDDLKKINDEYNASKVLNAKKDKIIDDANKRNTELAKESAGYQKLLRQDSENYKQTLEQKERHINETEAKLANSTQRAQALELERNELLARENKLQKQVSSEKKHSDEIAGELAAVKSDLAEKDKALERETKRIQILETDLAQSQNNYNESLSVRQKYNDLIKNILQNHAQRDILEKYIKEHPIDADLSLIKGLTTSYKKQFKQDLLASLSTNLDIINLSREHMDFLDKEIDDLFAQAEEEAKARYLASVSQDLAENFYNITHNLEAKRAAEINAEMEDKMKDMAERLGGKYDPQEPDKYKSFAALIQSAGNEIRNSIKQHDNENDNAFIMDKIWEIAKLKHFYQSKGGQDNATLHALDKMSTDLEKRIGDDKLIPTLIGSFLNDTHNNATNADLFKLIQNISEQNTTIDTPKEIDKFLTNFVDYTIITLNNGQNNELTEALSNILEEYKAIGDVKKEEVAKMFHYAMGFLRELRNIYSMEGTAEDVDTLNVLFKHLDSSMKKVEASGWTMPSNLQPIYSKLLKFLELDDRLVYGFYARTFSQTLKLKTFDAYKEFAKDIGLKSEDDEKTALSKGFGSFDRIISFLLQNKAAKLFNGKYTQDQIEQVIKDQSKAILLKEDQMIRLGLELFAKNSPALESGVLFQKMRNLLKNSPFTPVGGNKDIQDAQELALLASRQTDRLIQAQEMQELIKNGVVDLPLLINSNNDYQTSFLKLSSDPKTFSEFAQNHKKVRNIAYLPIIKELFLSSKAIDLSGIVAQRGGGSTLLTLAALRELCEENGIRPSQEKMTALIKSAFGEEKTKYILELFELYHMRDELDKISDNEGATVTEDQQMQIMQGLVKAGIISEINDLFSPTEIEAITKELSSENEKIQEQIKQSAKKVEDFIKPIREQDKENAQQLPAVKEGLEKTKLANDRKYLFQNRQVLNSNDWPSYLSTAQFEPGSEIEKMAYGTSSIYPPAIANALTGIIGLPSDAENIVAEYLPKSDHVVVYKWRQNNKYQNFKEPITADFVTIVYLINKYRTNPSLTQALEKDIIEEGFPIIRAAIEKRDLGLIKVASKLGLQASPETMQTMKQLLFGNLGFSEADKNFGYFVTNKGQSLGALPKGLVIKDTKDVALNNGQYTIYQAGLDDPNGLQKLNYDEFMELYDKSLKHLQNINDVNDRLKIKRAFGLDASEETKILDDIEKEKAQRIKEAEEAYKKYQEAFRKSMEAANKKKPWFARIGLGIIGGLVGFVMGGPAGAAAGASAGYSTGDIVDNAAK